MPKAPVKKAEGNAPAGAKVGRPHVPETYGLKASKEYLPWSFAEERLTASKNYWICSARPDGRPHSIPVWGFWLDGTLYFGTALESRKGKNLAHNPAVSVHLESGDEVVILEGIAVVVDTQDKAVTKRLDAQSRKKYQMPLVLTPDTVIYSVRPRVVLAWRERDFPSSATRWEFAAA